MTTHSSATPAGGAHRSRPVIGIIDSGLGLVGYADAVHQLHPGADLVLAMDPDWMPYGALDPQVVAERALASANALSPWEPDAIVVACNTASVHALDRLRAAYEPGTPIIGTVPAIKSAAAAGAEFAVWATRATTGSPYQEGLIARFASGLPVHQVACYGLADAIDAADEQRIDEAIAAAVAATPQSAAGIVLGCTHYGLIAERILRQRPATTALYDSPAAVARQTLARLGLPSAAEPTGAAPTPGDARTAADAALTDISDTGAANMPPQPGTAPPATAPADPTDTSGTGRAHTSGTAGGRVLATYMSGRRAGLPDTLDAYPAGRRLRAIEH